MVPLPPFQAAFLSLQIAIAYRQKHPARIPSRMFYVFQSSILLWLKYFYRPIVTENHLYQEYITLLPMALQDYRLQYPAS